MRTAASPRTSAGAVRIEEGAIAWDDPTLGIDWHLAPGDVVLSPKDSGHPRLAEAAELFDYNTDYYA